MGTGKQKIQLSNKLVPMLILGAKRVVKSKVISHSEITLASKYLKLWLVTLLNHYLLLHVPRKFPAPVVDFLPIKQDCRQIVARDNDSAVSTTQSHEWDQKSL